MQQPNLQQQGGAAPPAALNLSALSGGMPKLPVPAVPNVALDPQVAATQAQVAATQARAMGDMQEQQRLINSGSGVSQITHQVDPATGQPTNQPPSMLRRFGGALARIGDTALSIVSPGVAALTPGTTLHHDLLLNQQAGRVNNDLGDEQKQAQTAELNATPELRQLAAQNAFMKTQGLLGHYQDQANHWDDQTDQQLAGHGYKRDPQGKIVPMTYQELPPQMQAVEDLKQSQTELAEANKAYTDAKAKNLPLQMQMAEQRIATAQQNLHLSAAKLGLRQQEDDANYDGTYNGKPIGTFDEAGNPQGLRVTTANTPTSMRLKQSDLAHNVVSNAADINAVIDQRPDLFGKLQGRGTTVQQMIGSDDPDIARLGVMFHNIALASNGAHGLRSQEAVTQTENDLLNHFRNGPAATKAALSAMTGSMQTFIDAADRGKRPLPNPGSSTGAGKADFVYVPGKGLVKQ
jgi:hypothetical protein